MSLWLVTGLWVIIGCGEMAHLITLMTDRSLETYVRLGTVFVIAGAFVYIGILYWMKQKGVLVFKRKTGGGNPLYKVFFAFLTGLILVHFWRGYVPDLQDAVYEIAIGNVESGSIMSVHPFLGREGDASMPLRMQILGLSSLYSGLITISQQSSYIIVCKIIPTVVWICVIWVYKVFAEKLFPENKDRQWLFLSLIAFIFLITSGSEGLSGYRLFYAGFSGETIRGVVLLPYTLYVSWQKKWLLAVLAILTEACLVWTTFGIGYCSVVVLCMLLVHLWSDWRCKHAG